MKNKNVLLAYDFNETDYYPILALKKELSFDTCDKLFKEACTACNYHDYICLIDSADLEKIDSTAYYDIQAYSINMYKGHKI